jgi:hypothetical protein
MRLLALRLNSEKRGPVKINGEKARAGKMGKGEKKTGLVNFLGTAYQVSSFSNPNRKNATSVTHPKFGQCCREAGKQVNFCVKIV